MLTVRCAASIFATRDWLEPNRSATSVWVNPSCSRRRRRPSASASFTSTNRRSSADKPRKSPASPTVHPARSSLRRLSPFTGGSFLALAEPLKFGQALLALCDHALRRGGRVLPEDVKNYDRVRGNVVHDAPIRMAVDDAQFVTSGADGRHRPRLGQFQQLAALQSAQQEAGLDSGVWPKWRRLDLPPQPDERFVPGGSSQT